MRRQTLPTLKASIIFIVIFITITSLVWNFHSDASTSSNTKLKRFSAKLIRSSLFTQKLQKFREKAQKHGTVQIIVKLRGEFRTEGGLVNAMERVEQRSAIAEVQNQFAMGLRYIPSSLRKFDTIPYLAFATDSTGLDQLESSAYVEDLYEDKVLKFASAESTKVIGAQNAWVATYTGRGQTVAILDTGVDKDHSLLIKDGIKKVVSEACFSRSLETETAVYQSTCPRDDDPTKDGDQTTGENTGMPCDGNGCEHGTQVAGVAAGVSGVAIDANIVSVKVATFVQDMDKCSNGCVQALTSDVILGLEHVKKLHETTSLKIAAVNVSLATDTHDLYDSACDSVNTALTTIINDLKQLGIPTIIPSGNDKSSNKIAFPSCISNAISVGATNDGSETNKAQDTIWDLSNIASPTILDLLAPGSYIDVIPDVAGITYPKQGTSLAAAHVAGAIALYKQKNTSISVDDVLIQFKNTGVALTDGREGVVNGQTNKRLKIDSALGVDVAEGHWMAAYYKDRTDLSGDPDVVVDDGSDDKIDKWHNSSQNPVSGINPTNYSVRWTRSVTLTAGKYRFSVTGDDGVRIYVYDTLNPGINKTTPRIDKWFDQVPTTYNVDLTLSSGPHKIILEYFQGVGDAQARLIWRKLPEIDTCLQTITSGNWKGEYYNNMYLSGDPMMVRNDANVSFNWGGGTPESACNIFADYFSSRWTRTVSFQLGRYRFTTWGDNGIRLYIDGVLKIDRWSDTVATNTVDVEFSSSGDHSIKLEMYESWGGAGASVTWELLKPNAPYNLTANAVSSSQINLSWQDNSSDETGFKIERSTNGGGYSQIAVIGANTTSYSDASLSPATNYSYRVRAYNNAGDSDYSVTSSATTWKPIPAAPSNLTTTVLSPTQIRLTWTDNSPYEDNFEIDRSENGGSYTKIATLGSDVTSFTDASINRVATFTYRVRAYNATGYSDYSNTSTVPGQSLCTFSISPTEQWVSRDGGYISVSVNTRTGCQWSISSIPNWVHPQSNGGVGSGIVEMIVDSNPFVFIRHGMMNIAGITFRIDQEASEYENQSRRSLKK